jgi:LPS-assembly lipoprotein
MRLKVLAALALLPTVAACGFTPMYAQPDVAGGLARVAVETPDTRTGYLLRERLEDAFAGGPDAEDRYRLTVALNERRYPRGVGADDAATRYELAVQANWTLTDRTTGAQVARGSRPILVTYDASVQPYAGVAALDDAQERAASQAAQLIRVDLMTFFGGRRATP